MASQLFRTVLALVASTFLLAPLGADELSDDEIRQKIIEQSIRAYPGPCACPYSLMRNGRRCGGRSAYSRPGGHSPLCFARDVTDEMVQRYRKAHGL